MSFFLRYEVPNNGCKFFQYKGNNVHFSQTFYEDLVYLLVFYLC